MQQTLHQSVTLQDMQQLPVVFEMFNLLFKVPSVAGNMAFPTTNLIGFLGVSLDEYFYVFKIHLVGGF